MTCADVRCLAGNYVDEELPEELHARLQKHLLRCVACAEDLGSIGMAVRALRSTHAVPVASEEYIGGALERLAAELDVTTRPPSPPGQLVLGIGRE
ncbi:MAG: hypothetical protein K0Q72_4973 [Armatimonadetes bacterium]|jgi:anti-sigma factor RsiW|nr:hypothetical protein [Armatimonadota bacterium]